MRNLAIGLVLAIGILCLCWFLLSDGSGPGSSGSGSSEVAGGDGKGTAEFGSGGDADAASEGGETEQADLDVVEATGPVLLEGQVFGEGVGIPGAEVHFFSVTGVEDIIARIEKVVADSGGGMPDIKQLITAFRTELQLFRDRAITTKTDEEGKFALRGAPLGGYFVLTLANEWLFHFGDVVSLEEGRTAELIVNLERGASISGRVVDAAGAGRGGINVLAEYQPPGMQGVGKIVRKLLRLVNGEFLKGPFETRTASDGTFVISSLPPGLYDIVAIGDNGVENRAVAVETGSMGVVVYLGEGSSIAGVFVDDRGVPAAGVNAVLEPTAAQVSIPMPFGGFAGIANLVSRYLDDGPIETTSGSDGSFLFAHLGAGEYTLQVEHPGYLAYGQKISIGWNEEQSLGAVTLDRGATIRGVVRAEDGEPLGGATVMAVSDNVGFMNMGSIMKDTMTGRVQVRTAADGSFELSGLSGSSFRVMAMKPEFGNGNQDKVKPDGEPVELLLKRGQILTGRVVSAVDGNPIPNARVSASSASTRTAKDGTFELRGVLEPGTDSGNPFGGMGMAMARTVPMGGDRDIPRTIYVSVNAKGHARERVEMSYDELPTEIEVQLVTVPEVKGIVFDPDGAPMPGALVRLVPEMDGDDLNGLIDTSLVFLAVGVSDLEGRFSLDGYQTFGGSNFQIIADHVLYARGSSETFSLEGDIRDGAEVSVQLVRGATISGSVSDGRSIVAGAVVRLSKNRNAGGGFQPGGQERMMMEMMGIPKGGETTHTDSNGNFKFERVLPGDYSISAEMVGFTDTQEETFSLAAGGNEEFHFVLDPGGTFFGQVVDAQRNVVPEARVRILRYTDDTDDEIMQAQRFFGGAYKSTLTGDDGTFEVSGIPKARYTILVEKPGYTRVEMTNVYPGENFAPFVLVPAPLLRGQVVDATNGQPVTSFNVFVGNNDAEESWRVGLLGTREVNDPDGLFEREDLAPGSYKVNLVSPGFVTVSADVVLEAGRLTEERFELMPAGSITGRVTDAETGRPVEDVRVGLVRRVDDNGDDEVAVQEFFREALMGGRVRTDADGYYTLESVPLGPQNIVVRHDDYVQITHEGVEIESGRIAEVDFSLQRGITISGVVVDSSGAQLGNRFLFVRGTSDETQGIQKTVRADDDGEFSVTGLVEGKYRLVTMGGGSDMTPMELDVSEDRNDVRVVIPSE